jgi:hypothetical protein
MSQNPMDFSGDPTGDELLDDLLTPQQENFLTSHSGTSRPAYAQEGTEWLDKTSTPWILKRFDGSDDIIVGYINATTNTYTPAGLILDKVNATAAPTINDDDADGYTVGSKWVDVTNDRAYIAVDVSTGAAVWKEISGSLTGPGSSVDDEMALFSGTSGRVIKRASGTGYVKVISGVMQTPVATIPLTDFANQAANSVLANATGSSAPPTAVALSASKLLGRGSTGNVAEISLGANLSMSGTSLSAAFTSNMASMQVFTGSGTWNRPADVKGVIVIVTGGGGGGASNSSGGNGGTGGTSSFGAHCSATGGTGPSTGTPGTGGAGSSGNININGGGGFAEQASSAIPGYGGGTFWGPGASTENGNGSAIGSGAAGDLLGSSSADSHPGGGGGGTSIKFVDVSAISSVAVTVGAGGTAAGSGTGAAGIVWVIEFK